MTMCSKYVLVTPARNEEKFIERTLESVISQTILPEKYVVVSDGSTDNTDEIVKYYSAQHKYIELVRREPDGIRNFGSKVYAIREGVKHLKGMDYEFIGITDADISFEFDFMEKVIEKQIISPDIGICGGMVWEIVNGRWAPYNSQVNWSVSGAMQMFRRKCYENVGGYIPLKRGGIEGTIEVMARMHGWRVRTYEGIKLFHHRPMGSANNSVLLSRFKRGQTEYVNGYHPFFQLFRFFSNLGESPFLMSTSARTAGYIWSMLKREAYEVPKDVISYWQKEQLGRLSEKLFRKSNFSQKALAIEKLEDE